MNKDQYIAERIINDADDHMIWPTRGQGGIVDRADYTVHLNDDGTTSLYYTADLES